jgi:hypothetical protein
MTAKRKPMRARRAAPEPVAPTENQLHEAMMAFAKAKLRYRLIEVHESVLVEVRPEMMVGNATFMGVTGLPPVSDKPPPSDLAMTVHRFPDEPSARQWREREIIREAITAGMRAKP